MENTVDISEYAPHVIKCMETVGEKLTDADFDAAYLELRSLIKCKIKMEELNGIRKKWGRSKV